MSIVLCSPESIWTQALQGHCKHQSGSSPHLNTRHKNRELNEENFAYIYDEVYCTVGTSDFDHYTLFLTKIWHSGTSNPDVIYLGNAGSRS
jgi:hypothetical protein